MDGRGASLEEMIAASQDCQAFLPSIIPSSSAANKFSSFNSALSFQFRECWSAVAASVVDYYGRKKRGYFGVQQAFNPDPRDDGLARPRRGSGRLHLPARGFRWSTTTLRCILP